MATNADVNLKINVDKKDASAGISSFVKDVNSSLGEIVKGYGFVATAAVAVGLAIKAAFNAAEEIANIADETNKVNKQFDFLADAAGGSSQALRQAFEDVNQGIIDTEDILKNASIALVNLSLPAQDIAKNFEAARKIAVGFGGDANEAFQAINTAIASGNTRVLRQIGLFVDANQAVESYANGLGLAAKFLTEAQKEAALFNAIQSKINQSFSNVDIGTKTTSESFKQFGTAAKDVGEAVAIALTKIFGPSVQVLLGKFSEGLSTLATTILSKFGSETEKAASKQTLFNDKLTDAQNRLTSLQAAQEKAAGLQDSFYAPLIANQKRIVEGLQAEQERRDTLAQHAQAANDSLKSGSEERKQLTADEIKIQQELAKARSDFAQKTIAIESQIAQSKIQNSTNEITIQEGLSERLIVIEQERAKKIADAQLAAKQIGLGKSAELDAQVKAIKDQAALDEEAAAIAAQDRIFQAKINAAQLSGEIDTQGGLKSLEFQKKLVADQLAVTEVGTEQYRKLKAKEQKIDEDITKARYAITAQALGNLSTLMQTTSKELFAIGKVAALADATIRGYQAYNLALATIPPPFGFIVGATSLIAAGVQVAKIASTNLATGITEVPPGFPTDTFRANLTSGERVLSVPQNKDLSNFLEDQQNGKGTTSDEESKSILTGILTRLDNLQNTIVVNIGNKEIMREVREGIRSGQQVVA